MAMSEAQLMHADKMARGGSNTRVILEARQSDWKAFGSLRVKFARIGACICSHIRRPNWMAK